MPRRTAAGKRYAEAIANIARESGSWQRWRDDLHLFGRALADPVVRLTLASPRVAAERKVQLLDQALGTAVAPETRHLVEVMARRSRLDILHDVIAWFDEMADRALGIRRASVTSAVPLTEAERQQLQHQLSTTSGATQVVLDERVDPNIIGGLVVQQGDIIRDYSVRARLDSLRDRMN